jgi:hypothetical protein
MDTQVSPTASPGEGTRGLAGQAPCLHEEEGSASSVGGVNTTNLVFRSSQPRAQVEELVARDHNLLVLFEREEAKGVASGKK